MKRSTTKVTTFINPAGFIEQHYIGAQTGPSVTRGVQSLRRLVKKIQSQNKVPLVLIDITLVTTNDLESHKAAIKGMQEVPFKRVAIYGTLTLQILLNTLAIVADKYETVHAFNNRIDAIKWLRKDD
jgi:hypothetical protein